jgi:hypothetical protein
MAEEKLPPIEIVCDRPSGIYRVGEKAKFTITTPQPGVQVEAVFTSDGEILGSVKLKATGDVDKKEKESFLKKLFN